MDTLEEKIDKFVEISGLDRETANAILIRNDQNLEAAINDHLENGASGPSMMATSDAVGDVEAYQFPTPSESASLPDDDPCGVGAGDHVRAPIASRKEQLIMPEDDNFRCRKRKASIFTVCPLRNFEREAEIQEQQLRGLLEKSVDSSTSSTDGGESHERPEKISRLEDLYRPPVDLLFCGTFHAARQYATVQNRWLIVNLQDNLEFRSQIINRDLWTDYKLREMIKKHFTLWQVSSDNPEGLRFKTFYKVVDLPYICIIDPRTGEKTHECTVIRPRNVQRQFEDFLQKKSYVLDMKKDLYFSQYTTPGPSTSKSNTVSNNSTMTSTSTKISNASEENSKDPSTIKSNSLTALGCGISSSSTLNENHNNPSSRLYATELAEDEQLALAIKNSLCETHNSSNDVSSDDDGDGSLNDRDNVQENDTTNVCENSDSITKIQLRLPGGERVHLEWPSKTKIAAIGQYLTKYYKDIIKSPYKLITPFPRQDIKKLDQKLTLTDVNLHPTAIIFVHVDD